MTRLQKVDLWATGALASLALFMWLVATDPSLNAANPPASLTVPCEILEWHDGDTPTVRVTLDMRVRLLDCWAPEVATKDLAEKARGFASRDYAATNFPVGSQAVLEIPLEGKDRLDGAINMGRVLGRVWVDGKDVSAAQVKAGHATKSKEPK